MPLTYSDNLCAAYIAEIASSFGRHYADGFLGRTAMQKLVYFCQAVGIPIPCSFEIYNYGPYSDEVKFSVDSLIADEVLVDLSPNPAKYSNYRNCSSAEPFARALQDNIAPHRADIDRVVDALGKYRPEQLELVATLHFVACRQKAVYGIHPDRNRVISEFRDVKGDKFADGEIDSWYDALVKSGLI